VLVWIGALMALGALSTVRPDSTASPASLRHADDPGRRSALVELSAGLRLLRSDAQVRTLTGAIATRSWITGALDVGAAAIAIDVLRRDDASVSVLLTGFGAGGLIGSALCFALVGRRRLALALAGSVVMMCGFFAPLGRSTDLATATMLLVVVGAGVTLTSVAGRTMLQGLTPDDTLARLFGVLEALEAIGLALGGVALSVLAVQTSIETAFALVGGVGIVGLVVMWRRLLTIDRARRPVDRDLLQLARSSPVLASLPPYAVEQVMSGLTTETFAAGEVLMRIGEVGDRVCLIGSGSVDVRTETGTRLSRGVGVLLGEIALLRKVPRTADVTAGDDGATVHWMNVDAFLDAINRVPRSRSRADAEVDRRLQK
ncbi:MAG: cyclic nucleotide-binding domain-containing protein, partial [Ilumatobacter sp.]